VAEQKVDSYIVALVMAVVPLAVASFDRFLFRKSIPPPVPSRGQPHQQCALGVLENFYPIPQNPEPHFPRSQPLIPVWQAGSAPWLWFTWEANRLSFLSIRTLPHSGQAITVSERIRSSKSLPQAEHLYSNIGMVSVSSLRSLLSSLQQERTTRPEHCQGSALPRQKSTSKRCRPSVRFCTQLRNSS
jgi:hypothetical protein